MEIIQLISAAGIGGIVGSLLTTVVQSWLADQSYLTNRNFQEKKEAYVGFLKAGHLNEIEQSHASSMEWAYWKARCELVASPKVIELVNKMEETNPIDGQIHPDRLQVWTNLKEAMREDLHR